MRRSKLFASSFGGLPDGFVRIVITDDGEELLALTNLPRFLPGTNRGKARIVSYNFV